MEKAAQAAPGAASKAVTQTCSAEHPVQDATFPHLTSASLAQLEGQERRRGVLAVQHVASSHVFTLSGDPLCSPPLASQAAKPQYPSP